ncbi:family 3 adenylate cyclase [Mycolicibacterium canariasense]|uniref:Family 3 adenylate cyclase n=1 Tax=Mycolicibacterium canariasense TaxID=228230 RepID=A0A100WJG7_MYCCR|nr:adenylate/guanylate cyclase domain-containing protein [Mycolicibacterium canariasense]MCV7208031.1 adenylate/guanylate cyclase domain-containing protein [Mycolicibacterium canariasense]ORV11106.1 cyclase [Mycolicibacterium canariasense]GAS99226.1 family 3 adenylate cyclase [Mycolicibacterium canariasense]
MDRIWQWAWDRFGARHRWAGLAVVVPAGVPVYLFWSFLIVALERSRHYVEAAVVTLVILLWLNVYAAFADRKRYRPVEQWVAGHDVDRATALKATYTFARSAAARVLWLGAVGFALMSIAVGAIAGAGGPRLAQYGLLGAAIGTVTYLISVHSILEATARPARLAIAGDTSIGDSLPRARPTIAAWSRMTVLGTAFIFSVESAMLASAIVGAGPQPLLFLGIGGAMTVGFGVPLAVGVGFSPSMRPIRDLAEGTERVAAGDYGRRVPVVQDDDLGVLAASFNRMQAGLAERQRLQAAFGAYVDPALAARLLEQGDDVFTGERREVTVMFVDVRDFTPFAEANTAEDTVARLNALFEIVVPAVVDAGGHVNKFLGDGALAVFGAPDDLADHADAAVSAAVQIHRRVAQRFGGELRIGIGINTGSVIAGTIGAGPHLEFTLIGDTTNVAARVEQLTKTTRDAILLTQGTVEALVSRPPGLIDRGSHALKGKSAPTVVFGLDPVRSP